MPRRLAALLAFALAGCGAVEAAPPRPAATPTPSPTPGLPLDAKPPKAGAFAGAVARRLEREARLRRAIARARRSTTVEGALRLARLTGGISMREEANLRRDWASANARLAKLSGARRAELAYAVATVRQLAATHRLTTKRIAPTFLILRVNTRHWAAQPFPTAGWRTTIADAVFQYYPGRGLQLQPLASWGRANALAGACLDALRSKRTRDRCRRVALTRALDRLTRLGARRSGYLAWEYYFAFGSGAPPWVSGMAQGTAIQALARGYRALGKRRWRRAALDALGAFEQPPPAGVSVPAPGGAHYLLYSFAPSQRVFNGGLQAVIGLRDAAALIPSKRARRLFARGERAARRELAHYDTGAWSLYSAHGAEANLNYHSLVAGFLKGLCERVHRRVYCAAAKRFKRYEREPTRIELAPLRKLRADRVATVSFTISKVSDVKVRVWGSRGLSLARDMRLPRGRHALAWRPPGRGRYRLRIEAQGPSGPVGIETRTIRITQPKPKRKRKIRPNDASPKRSDVRDLRADGSNRVPSRRRPARR